MNTGARCVSGTSRNASSTVSSAPSACPYGGSKTEGGAWGDLVLFQELRESETADFRTAHSSGITAEGCNWAA
jgi:hypothetical protein